MKEAHHQFWAEKMNNLLAGSNSGQKKSVFYCLELRIFMGLKVSPICTTEYMIDMACYQLSGKVKEIFLFFSLFFLCALSIYYSSL